MEPNRPVLPTVTELRSHGMPYDRIAERLGVSLATLWASILDELATQRHDAHDSLPMGR